MSIALRTIAGFPESLNAAWQRAKAGTWDARLFRVGILFALLIGLLLRVSGQYFDQSSLWLDEAAWANRLLIRSVMDMPIRPIAFMWISQQLVALTSPTEFWLRFLLNAASIVALGFMPYIASRLFESKVSRFLLVIIWAIQPALIDYAKEFKPYSFEVLIHLIPLLLYLKYRETGKIAYFYSMIGLMPVLFLFAYNLAFTFPGVFLWALYEGYKQRKLKGAAVPVVSGLACLALIGGLYTLTLHKASTGENETYWGKKYDVFYTKFQADEGQTRASWMARKYTDMASLPGLRREVWHPPAFVPDRMIKVGITADRVFWLALHLAGMGYLLARRRELFVLMVIPYFVLIALNLVGRWPIGAFRTNVFLCAYMLPLAVFGFDWIARRSFKNAASMGAVVAAITLVPAFAYGFDINEKKAFWGARNHEGREILDALVEHREAMLKVNPNAPPEYIFLDCHIAYSHRYYMTVHPETKAKYAEYFKKNYVQSKGCGVAWFYRALKAKLKKPGDPFLVIVAKKRMLEMIPPYLRENSKILSERRFGSEYKVDHLMFRVESLKGPKKPKAAVAPATPDGKAPEAEEGKAAVDEAAAPSHEPDDDKEPPAPAGSADRDDDDD